MLPKGLLKEYSQALSWVLRGCDMLAVMLAGLFAFFYKFGHLEITVHYSIALLLSAGLTLIVFAFFRLYDSVRGRSFWQYCFKLMQAIFVVLMILAGLAFLSKTGESYSRGWFLCWALFSLALLILTRCCIFIALRLMRMHGLNERRVIIIGAGQLGHKLADTVQQALWTGFRIERFFDDHCTKPYVTRSHIPVEPTPLNLSAYLTQAKHSIDEIWLALPLRAEERVKALLFELRHHTVTIRFVLDIFGFDLFNHTITDIAGLPTLNLNASPMVGLNRLVKAIEDRVLAALILLLVSPLMLLIALGIKCTSKGPIIFKQLRHGWDGRIIKVYKFRTMVVHDEKNGQVVQATAHDERVTWFGRLLRKTSLDELPQFFNVLQGRMSIVGPRPHAIAHNELYKDSIKAYMQRHKVKPGITGWAQVNGWRGETKQLEKMERRVEYDLFYIENWSLGLDLKIIFLTLFQGFIHKNAY